MALNGVRWWLASGAASGGAAAAAWGTLQAGAYRMPPKSQWIGRECSPNRQGWSGWMRDRTPSDPAPSRQERPRRQAHGCQEGSRKGIEGVAAERTCCLSARVATLCKVALASPDQHVAARGLPLEWVAWARLWLRQQPAAGGRRQAGARLAGAAKAGVGPVEAGPVLLRRRRPDLRPHASRKVKVEAPRPRAAVCAPRGPLAASDQAC